MSNTHCRRLACALFAVALVCALASAIAGANPTQNTRPGTAQALVLEDGREVMLRFNGMTKVIVVDPEVADVIVASPDDLLVVSTYWPPLRDQVETMMYVYDRDGLHKFAITIVSMRVAERVAHDLQESIGPNLNVEAVSDTLVVVEGQVPDEDALDNLKTLLEAASTEEVRVVAMVTTARDSDSPAARTGEALSQILDPRLKVTSWGDDVIVVEGELESEQAAVRARQAVTALTEGLRVVDMITVAGQDAAEQAPVAQIQRLLGEDFVVTQLGGKLIAVDGVVESEAELERVNRLLAAYSEQVQTINMVRVVPPRPDVASAQGAIQSALGEEFRVTAVGDEALMIEGSVPSEEGLTQVEEVLSIFEGRLPILNLVTVVEPQRRRILVAVKVIELTRGADEELGIDWGQYAATGDGVSYRPQPFLMGQVSGLDGWRELFNFATQIHALVTARKASVLSEPNLLVNENEEAEILIGGEIPIPIATAGVGGFAQIHVEYKTYGVNLKIKPTIGPDNETVQLMVAPEVSSLDYGNGVTLSGLTIPGLRSRRATTIVTIPDGAVLAIGGLIAHDQSEAVSKIPILGDLPIIGQFFRHNTTIDTQSELIILVLPQILGEDGQPLHPIPVPEGFEGDVLDFGGGNAG